MCPLKATKIIAKIADYFFRQRHQVCRNHLLFIHSYVCPHRNKFFKLFAFTFEMDEEEELLYILLAVLLTKKYVKPIKRLKKRSGVGKFFLPGPTYLWCCSFGERDARDKQERIF